MVLLKQRIHFTNHKKMKEYKFYIKVFVNGNQYVSCSTLEKKYSALQLVLHYLGHSINELLNYKSRLEDATNAATEQRVGYNDFCVLVFGENCKIGEYGDNFEENAVIPISLLFRFIDDAVDFIGTYNSGAIEGIIPSLLKSELMVVKREYENDTLGSFQEE